MADVTGSSTPCMEWAMKLVEPEKCMEYQCQYENVGNILVSTIIGL